MGLARGWGRGAGPRALLACPEDERHDLGLIAFGLALRERGWRIDYLGPDTPVESIEEAARRTAPAVVVLCAVRPEPLQQGAALAARYRVAIAGAGAKLAPRLHRDALILLKASRGVRLERLVPHLTTWAYR